VAVGDRVVIFGGTNGKACSNDTWLYDRVSFTWLKPKVTGLPPSPRHGHSAQFDEAGARLVVFGGCTYDAKGHPRYENDVREMDLRSMTWGRSRVSGDYPSPRYWHGAGLLGNVMVSFGGWGGPRDPASAAGGAGTPAGTVTMPYQPGLGFNVPTGGDAGLVTVPFGVHPSTYFLDLDGLEWVQPQVAGKPPGYRYGASVAAYGLQVIIFGGWEDSRSLYETLVLDISALASGGAGGGAAAGDGGDAAEHGLHSEEERQGGYRSAAAAAGGVGYPDE
jgi:hypothetical protein